jgi:biotin carboxyl carrier protein
LYIYRCQAARAFGRSRDAGCSRRRIARRVEISSNRSDPVNRKFRITVDGHAYDVVVEEIASDAPHGAPVAHQPAAAIAAAAPAAPSATPHAVAGPGAEVAPLAGVVISIDVAVGQTVGAGARIATIEAMKMKTEVFAKGAGRVTSIAVAAGDAVDTGGVLLILG